MAKIELGDYVEAKLSLTSGDWDVYVNALCLLDPKVTVIKFVVMEDTKAEVNIVPIQQVMCITITDPCLCSIKKRGG